MKTHNISVLGLLHWLSSNDVPPSTSTVYFTFEMPTHPSTIPPSRSTTSSDMKPVLDIVMVSLVDWRSTITRKQISGHVYEGFLYITLDGTGKPTYPDGGQHHPVGWILKCMEKKKTN